MEISNQIIGKAEIIAHILSRGNTAEIKRNTDGTIKVLEVQRKVK